MGNQELQVKIGTLCIEPFGGRRIVKEGDLHGGVSAQTARQETVQERAVDSCCWH